MLYHFTAGCIFLPCRRLKRHQAIQFRFIVSYPTVCMDRRCLLGHSPPHLHSPPLFPNWNAFNFLRLLCPVGLFLRYYHFFCLSSLHQNVHIIHRWNEIVDTKRDEYVSNCSLVNCITLVCCLVLHNSILDFFTQINGKTHFINYHTYHR